MLGCFPFAFVAVGGGTASTFAAESGAFAVCPSNVLDPPSGQTTTSATITIRAGNRNQEKTWQNCKNVQTYMAAFPCYA
jgi:hypothetical protein